MVLVVAVEQVGEEGNPRTAQLGALLLLRNVDGRFQELVRKLEIKAIPELAKGSPGDLWLGIVDENGLKGEEPIHAEAASGDALGATTTDHVLYTLQLLWLEGAPKAHRLKVVELLVTQGPVTILVAQLEDPLKGGPARLCQLPRGGIEYHPLRVHRCLLCVKEEVVRVHHVLCGAFQPNFHFVEFPVDLVRHLFHRFVIYRAFQVCFVSYQKYRNSLFGTNT